MHKVPDIKKTDTLSKGFDREVSTWNSLYNSQSSSQQKRYAIFQKNAAERTVRRMELCLELLDPKPGMKILDLGCGSGILGQKISDKKAAWYGTDISFNMLKYGKGIIENSSSGDMAWVNGNANCIPFQKSVFDAVTCIGVINFYKQEMLGGLLNEIERVLKPGGSVIFTSLRLDILTWIRSRFYPWIPLPVSSPGPLYPMHYSRVLKDIESSRFKCAKIIHVKDRKSVV